MFDGLKNSRVILCIIKGNQQAYILQHRVCDSAAIQGTHSLLVAIPESAGCFQIKFIRDDGQAHLGIQQIYGYASKLHLDDRDIGVFNS